MHLSGGHRVVWQSINCKISIEKEEKLPEASGHHAIQYLRKKRKDMSYLWEKTWLGGKRYVAKQYRSTH
jgi:hypothetical protein